MDPMQSTPDHLYSQPVVLTPAQLNDLTVAEDWDRLEIHVRLDDGTVAPLGQTELLYGPGWSIVGAERIADD